MDTRRPFWVLVLAVMAAAMFVAPPNALAAADPRVRVSSPREGEVFEPGQTVSVTVSVAMPVSAGYIAVGAPGIGIVQGTGYNGSSYQASFTIPDVVAGPLEIIPFAIDASGTPIEGTPVTIQVRSKSPPLRLHLLESEIILLSLSGTANIYVNGEYPNHVERDLTSSATGTTYRSSDTRVVKVNGEGKVSAVSWGVAVVTVMNSGLKALATVRVENGGHPIPPVDVTDQLKVELLPTQLTDHYSLTVRVSNAGSLPIQGQLYIVLSGLPPKSVVFNAGKTKRIEPIGSPYRSLKLPDGLNLQPGQSASAAFDIYLMSTAPVNYTVRVFRSALEP